MIKLPKLRARRPSETPSATDSRPKKTGRLLRRFTIDLMRDTRASVLALMAVSMLALGTATGVGIDFARGLNFKSSLQGAADSAAIAGASVYLNAGYSSQATTAATNYMAKAVANLPTNNGVSSSIALSQSAPWTVTVNATASINSSFNGLFENTIPVQVTATAHAPTNPNIDFYLLLDSSPSMGIAATQTGINTMVANTQGQCDSPPNGGTTCGCAFACHESNPSSESYYLATGTKNTSVSPQETCSATPSGPNPSWPPSSPGSKKAAYYYCWMSGTGNPTGEDNLALARALGVTLRIDNLQTATQNLMSTAQTTAASNDATYRAGIYTFDINFNTIQTLTASLNTAKSSAANIAQLEMYSNNHLTSGDNNQDADTNMTNAFTQINSVMPNPGGGTKVAGDTPQEVLMFVSDGVEDEMVNGTRTYTTVSNDTCNAIKNRGIRIAVLYTVYYPLTTNGWYNSNIAPFQSNIAAAMQACASPGLYFAVDTGGDISAAMTALFNSAVQSAYISH